MCVEEEGGLVGREDGKEETRRGKAGNAALVQQKWYCKVPPALEMGVVVPWSPMVRKQRVATLGRGRWWVSGPARLLRRCEAEALSPL